MLYPENEKPALPLSVFKNPGAEYRVTPFWAWNRDYASVWYGPGAWRSEGCGWTNEYRPRESGVMAAPRLLAQN